MTLTAELPRIRLGMITPSSNTSLEPITARLLAGVPTITAHFSRLRVTEISMGSGALAQFDPGPMIETSSLLADMRPHSIVWNGTSGGWRGLEADRQLCAAIEKRFEVPTTTVTLALAQLLKDKGIGRVSFVTPYTADVQELILGTFAGEGITATFSPCLGISENFAFSAVTEATLDRMVAEAAAERPDAILPFCTNLPATPFAARWESEFDITIIDSIALATRVGLELAGVSPSIISGWGRLFSL
jgi:maleate isomerase